MPRRRLKEAAALTALHPAGMSESPRHAGKPGLSACLLMRQRTRDVRFAAGEGGVETRLNILASNIDTLKH